MERVKNILIILVMITILGVVDGYLHKNNSTQQQYSFHKIENNN